MLPPKENKTVVITSVCDDCQLQFTKIIHAKSDFREAFYDITGYKIQTYIHRWCDSCYLKNIEKYAKSDLFVAEMIAKNSPMTPDDLHEKNKLKKIMEDFCE